jgi:hypothetical protein
MWLSIGGKIVACRIYARSYPCLLAHPNLYPEGYFREKKSYRFLCSWNKEKEGIPLVKWQAITKPNEMGGWGLKNIYYFGKSLVVKSVWRLIFKDGLWNWILIEKYVEPKLV